MTRGVAIVDGVAMPLAEAVVPVSDPAFASGWSVFETLVVRHPHAERLSMHLERLADSCAATCIAMPDRAVLEREVGEVVARIEGPVRVRITLTGGGIRVVAGEPLEEGRANRPIRAVRGGHCNDPFIGGATKHGSRAPWVVARERSGADEVLLVDEAGRFTEGTRTGVLAVIDGVLWTAPYDGRILPSTTVRELVRIAGELGIEVRREGPPADGPWDALYVAAVTRELAPVVELDGVALPGWDPIGTRLAAAYRGF